MHKFQWWFIIVVVMSLLLATGAFAAQDAGRPRTAVQAHQDGTVTPEPTPYVEHHPVILAMSAYFGVPSEEIRGLFDSGVGLGVLARAYVLADLLGKTPQEIIDIKTAGQTPWGQLRKEVKGTPGADVSLGKIMSGKVTPEPTASGDGSGLQVQDRDKDLEREQKHDQKQDIQSNDSQPGNSAGGGGGGNGHGSGNSNGGGKGGGGKGK